MIYTPRSSSGNRTCTRMEFQNFVISIAMDDRGLGSNSPLTRTNLVVFNKEGKDVTAELPGITNATEYGIENCDAQDLYNVMQAIARLPVALDVGQKSIMLACK